MSKPHRTLLSIVQRIVFQSFPALFVVAAIATLPGCGGDDNPAGPGADGPMSATIDGESWTAGGFALAQTVPNVPGAFILTGTEAFVAGRELRSMTLTLYSIAGAGTYPLGVNLMVPGGNAIVANTTSGWGTPLSGAAGTITITTFSETRIAGTFSFVASATTGSATGSATVTDGEFDLELPGASFLPIPDNAISVASASIDDEPWNAATLASTTSGGNFVLVANNTERNITLIVQSFSEDTFPLSSSASVSVSSADPTCPDCCWGHGTGASGTITISSITAPRIAGSFEVSLVPSSGGATGSITLAGGQFDVGRR
jgi:hypothetical protein